MDFPEIFKGSPTPTKWAALGEHLSKGQITGGPGIRVRRVGNNTVITTRRATLGGVEEESVPFKLTVTKDEDDWKWKVSQNKSSIQDGTNGDAIDLGPSGTAWATGAIMFDTTTTLTATKFILLEADVDADLVITDWTLVAANAADAKELRFTTSGTIYQDKIRLLIGKITVDTAPDPDTYVASQAVFSPQMITHGLNNGLAVKCFLASPIQVDNL